MEPDGQSLTGWAFAGKAPSIDTAPPLTTATPVDRLRDAILHDPALQQRLSVIDRPEAFSDAAIAVATDLGLSIDRDAVARGGRPDPLGLERFGAAPPWTQAWPIGDWRPIDVVPAPGGLAVDWAHFGGERPTDPFYAQSANRARARPLNQFMRLRTPLSALVATAPARLRRPDGFIYHLSRCGSTLVAQMLTALRGATVLSEPPPLDTIVQLVSAQPQAPEADRLALVRAMIGALGQSREEDADGPFFIKLDSWHSLALPLIRSAFPDTPWIFLYRDPVEIMVSHRAMRGMQMVPGVLPDAVFGIADGGAMPLDDYGTLVLARLCQAILDDSGAGGLLLNYTDLPGAVTSAILPHFGVAAGPEALDALTRAAGRDAKQPDAAFTPDTAKKRQSADAALHKAAAPVTSAYRRLEQRRLEQRRLEQRLQTLS